MDSYQEGRLARAAEVLGEARERRPGSGAELVQDQGVTIGKLCYWLADMLQLARELDGREVQADNPDASLELDATAEAEHPVRSPFHGEPGHICAPQWCDGARIAEAAAAADRADSPTAWQYPIAEDYQRC